MPFWKCDLYVDDGLTPPFMFALIDAGDEDEANHLIDAELHRIDIMLQRGELVATHDLRVGFEDGKRVRIVSYASAA